MYVFSCYLNIWVYAYAVDHQPQQGRKWDVYKWDDSLAYTVSKCILSICALTHPTCL